MNRKRVFFVVLLILLALAAVSIAAAEGQVHLNASQVQPGEATVSVLLLKEKRDTTDPDAWRNEIRCFSYDPENSIYETGEGEPPADGITFIGWLENGYGYTVRITKPGKYLLSGMPFYVLDLENEKLGALYEELENVLAKYDRETQKKTGQSLYGWLIKKVSCKLPDSRPELSAICTDPVNCLLTGYALPETYAAILQLVLKHAGIESLQVNGTVTLKNEPAEWNWNICRLDGKWLYADMGLDDRNNNNGGDYYGRDLKGMSKNHTLSDKSEGFIRDMIRSCSMDILLGDDRETASRLELTSNKQGYYYSGYYIDGPEYSLGESGPVTIRHIQNFRGGFTIEESGLSPEEYVRRNVLMTRIPWDDRYHAYPYFLEGSEITPEMVTLLEYEPDMSRVVVQFHQPGMYMLNGGNVGFVVLDPEREEFAEVARLLDEAGETCVGTTEKETAKLLQDWVASQLVYNQKAYRNMVGLVDEVVDEGAQDPFNSLITKTAVCGGYASLYRLLLSNAGIHSFKIYGKVRSNDYVGHAWNVARLDGTWCYMDATWDDVGKKSGTEYFARDREYFEKNRHHPDQYDSLFLDQMIETPVYDLLIRRFDAEHALPVKIPAELSILPASAEACRFPTRKPEFYRFTQLEYEQPGGITFSVDGAIQAGKALVYSGNGDKNYRLSYSLGYWKKWPRNVQVNMKNNIVTLRLQNYPDGMRPVDKSCFDQTLRFDFGKLTESEYCYHVPMKKNEIRGYSEKSYRTWTWNMDMKPVAASWNLVSDIRNLDITVRFDEEGKTERYTVAVTPAGGDQISWEAKADGTIVSVGFEQGEINKYTLTDLTETWTEPRYRNFQEAFQRYPELEGGTVPEGIFLYLFTNTGVSPVLNTPIVTDEPLLRWTDTGLELKLPETDIRGKQLWLKTDEEPDLSLCRKIPVGTAEN